METKYCIYPTLLDSFYWYKRIDGAKFTELLYKINKVQKPSPPAAQKGIDFESCVNMRLRGQRVVGKHSQKPHYFRKIISEAVKVSFDQPEKLELFARTREGMFGDHEYDGWDVYGNEVNNSITLSA